MFRYNPYRRKMRTWPLQGMAEEKDFIGDRGRAQSGATRGDQTEPGHEKRER